MVYGLLRALPGDRLVDTVIGGITSADLTPAPRRQDHTSSPSALASPVKRAFASTAPRPASVTFAKRPSEWDGMARACRDDLPDDQSGIFLREGLDRLLGDLPVGPARVSIKLLCAGAPQSEARRTSQLDAGTRVSARACRFVPTRDSCTAAISRAAAQARDAPASTN
jgi:hypothetical protein